MTSSLSIPRFVGYCIARPRVCGHLHRDALSAAQCWRAGSFAGEILAVTADGGVRPPLASERATLDEARAIVLAEFVAEAA